MAREGALHGVRNLAERGAGAGRFDGGRKQIALTAGRDLFKGLEGCLDGLAVAGFADTGEPRDLAGTHLGIVDFENVDRGFVLQPEPVDADNDVFAAVDAGCLRVAASSMRIFGRPCSTALVMPPRLSTSWIMLHASSANCAVSAST